MTQHSSRNKIAVLFGKELKLYFSSPVAYLLIFFFTVSTSLWLFQFQGFFVRNIADYRPFFSIMPFLFIFLVPAVTMRTWAEEHKSGSDELLFTLPYSEGQLVIGKFLAAVMLFFIMMLVSLIVPLSTLGFGYFDIGVLFANYLGLLLIITAEVSIGTYISSLSKNQISTFLVTTMILFVITLIGFIPSFVQIPQFIARILYYMSFLSHYNSFVKGLFDSRDFTFFVVISLAFLFLTRQGILNRKWR